jgi:hypothetical protein
MFLHLRRTSLDVESGKQIWLIDPNRDQRRLVGHLRGVLGALLLKTFQRRVGGAGHL